VSADFAGLLGTLTSNSVKFIVIGGAAAIAHGSSRMTQDLDIVYERSLENLSRICDALGVYKPYLRGVPPGLPFRLDAETLRRGLNFTLTTDLGDVDLFGDIPGGGGYSHLIDKTLDLEIFGYICKGLDLETLIAVKKAAGRPKDLEAVAELELIREELES